MIDQASVRNLERIQESEGAAPKVASWALVSALVCAVSFAWVALGTRKSAPVAKSDPLGDLVAAEMKGGKAGGKIDLSPRDVTFPALLSDRADPTTALAAVRTGSVDHASSDGPSPPPATDRLAVVPLPAQNVLMTSPVVSRPRDRLTRAASDAAQAGASHADAAGPGHDGGYQLQVSSFRSDQEAGTFADQLRARGHKAYVQEAHVPGRGTWYRVRIGPFGSPQAASAYRASFEAKEHVVPFVVPPPSKDKDHDRGER